MPEKNVITTNYVAGTPGNDAVMHKKDAVTAKKPDEIMPKKCCHNGIKRCFNVQKTMSRPPENDVKKAKSSSQIQCLTSKK